MVITICQKNGSVWALYNTVDKNNIGAPKMQNYYSAIKLLFFFQCCESNIGLFSIAPCKIKNKQDTNN